MKTSSGPPHLRRAREIIPFDTYTGRPHRDHSLKRVRPGVYADASGWEQASTMQQYLALIRAAFLSTSVRPAWVSHASAAAILGIPLVSGWPRPIHLTRDGQHGGRHDVGIVWHKTPTPPTLLRDGLPLTAPARIVVDVARSEGLEGGIMAADYVLGQGLANRQQMDEQLDCLRGTKGIARARWICGFASDLSDSPGESVARLRLSQVGAPEPELQVCLFDDEGFIGRVDFFWPNLGIVAEFDGKIKYDSDALRPGRDAAKVLYEEKQREDRLRRLGLVVIRMSWSQVADPVRLAALLGEAGLPLTR